MVGRLGPTFECYVQFGLRPADVGMVGSQVLLPQFKQPTQDGLRVHVPLRSIAPNG